jgi:predicted phage tail protein
VVVRWTAPASNGGSPILRYEVEVLSAAGKRIGGIRTAPATAAQLTVTGLQNGTGYRFRVRAVNAVGAGTQSAASATATPRTVPAAPAKMSAKPGPSGGAATATVTWTAPPTTGGAPITGYRVTWQRLTAGGTALGSPAVTTVRPGVRAATYAAPAGVRSGSRYRVTVQALNAVGAGRPRTAFTTLR